MIANLYIHKDAFQYNGTDSEEQVKQKIHALANDMRAVVYENSNENVFHVSEDALNSEVYSGVTLINAPSKYLEGDLCGIMYSMLANTSDQYESSIEDLYSLTSYSPDEEEANTLVVLNRPFVERDITHYIQFDKYEIVYNQSSWVTFRRQILGNHPGTSSDFIINCRKYFDNLVFHDNCIDTLQDDKYEYLSLVPRKIVYYLSCLNDGFTEVRRSHANMAPDPNSILEDFSGQFKLDEPGSLERDVTKKQSLTFSFVSTEDTSVTVNMLCEPHLKISQPDDKKFVVDFRSFHPRIYFHFGDPYVENGKILIGIIGRHI